MHSDNTTIYAPSSAIGGAIAVIRISGPDAKRVETLFDRDIFSKPSVLRRVMLSQDGERIDDGMAVYFRAPHSYTGEDMVEINCHGGAETVRRILAALSHIGFEPAEGGAFTKRAFLAGKLDLSQAEAVMDLIQASADASRRAALEQLAGSVSETVHGVEAMLLDALSGMDAAIDYPDEAEDEMTLALPKTLDDAEKRLKKLIDDARRGHVLRDGVRVAILGRPNVGKSSLLNALLGRERAIVTEVAGTTRDILDESTSFSGVPIRLIDTAGIREASDEAERIGVRLAREAARDADILLLVLDGGEPLTDADRGLLRDTAADARRLVVVNKSDREAAWDIGEIGAGADDVLTVSARQASGLDTLKTEILKRTAPRDAAYGALTNERHIALCEAAHRAVCDAMRASEVDCAATDVRDALHALGGITGTDVDAEVIDRIFARFCVGK